MNTIRIRLRSPIQQCLTVSLTGLLFAGCPLKTMAVDPPRITHTAVAAGKFSLIWTGNSYSYEVQSTTNLAAPHWAPVLATARTNGVIPLNGNSTFFRVVGPTTNPAPMVLTVTNLASGDWHALTLQPQTNADLVFTAPSDSNGLPVVLYPFAELQKVDVLFDTSGGFTLVTTNGGPTGGGGWMLPYPGPGTNEVTYRGILTNSLGTFAFSTVTASAPPGGRLVLKGDGGPAGTGGTIVNGVVVTQAEQQCISYVVLLKLACDSQCPLQGVICAFQGKTAYCDFVVKVSWGTNNFFGYPSECGGCD